MKTPTNVRIAGKVSRLVLAGLRLLQCWSCVVLECMAWKHTHPCSQAAFLQAGGDPKGKGMEYERVVRYNWSANELSALVEVGGEGGRDRCGHAIATARQTYRNFGDLAVAFICVWHPDSTINTILIFTEHVSCLFAETLFNCPPGYYHYY